MVEGAPGQDPAPRSPLQEALLEEIWLENVLDRVLLLADRDRQGREAYRAAGELAGDGFQQSAIAAVEPSGVDLQHLQRVDGDGATDASAFLHLGEVPDPLQQPVRDPWGAA